MPATTWALVTTRPGASTQPLPSWPRLQAAATPVTLTTERAAPATPPEAVTASLGLATGGIGSTPTPSKTRGKPSRSSTARKPANRLVVWAGTARSIVCRMRDVPMARASGAGAPPRTAPATNHTRIETATSEATPPRTASSARAGFRRTCRRIRAPTDTARACPTEASTKTPKTSSTVCHRTLPPTLVQRCSSCGSSHMPSAPPDRNPTSDMVLTSRPCR